MNTNYQKSFFGVKNAGFTLIELLVVVLIIGILSAVALPQYNKAVFKSRMTQAQIILTNIAQAQLVYKMANGVYADKLDQLDVELPPQCTVFVTPGAADGVSCEKFSYMIPVLQYAPPATAMYNPTGFHFDKFEDGTFACRVGASDTVAQDYCRSMGYAWN